MASRPATTSETVIEPFHHQLRARTRACHERVDSAFSTFALNDARSYGAFLSAHASVLLPVERWLDAAELVPGWHGRGDALARDIAALGHAIPAPVDVALPRDAATRWGALYVIEGSRLGGRVLGGMVREGLPKEYLAAPFSSLDWRGLLASLDREGAANDQAWRDDALAGAVAIFGLFEGAAATGKRSG
jgi:heme oxygenase